MSFYGWPISQCQSLLTSNPLLFQLQSGIRALDIRLSIKDGRLISFHGIYPQRSPFTSILDTLCQFLTADEGSSECIVVSIKQEDTASPLFTSLVHSEIAASPGGDDIWYTESNRIPTLGEVRGKCVLVSRFGELGGEALGIHPDRWPDSQKDGFEWNCGETLVRVSDWYAIPSFLNIPEKVAHAASILLPLHPPTSPAAPSQNQNTLSITFFSASSIPLALPPMIARGFGWPKWGLGVSGVNERVGRWLLSTFAGDAPNPDARSISRFFNLNTANPKKAQTIRKKGAIDEPRIRGWVYMDFYEDPVESGVIPLLVECNFRGRKLGEEGWI
ncbi:hypothetical protein PILCRDRAFT_63700 [Piloderma croceum F 1598]|uniref:Phosphatidylinositol-specific phospholipase C X domain-containing protein n=1 Tax=Piloderma croceum (strain F 1598) TaxID=765440 RepID=A0A0C3BLY7_PILCF|nr:hypothetical protein PILCRDRAFT_63700 [Piloderma croceum F 1598]